MTQRIAHSSNTDLVSSLQSDVRLITDEGEVIVSSFDLSPEIGCHSSLATRFPLMV